VDYVFRRLALDHLPPEKREALGIRFIEERKQLAQQETAAEAFSAPAPTELPIVKQEPEVAAPKPTAKELDAPLCYSCGSRMQPAGSCYVCSTCGSTSGCS
jgi:ribonucleoside-diphosphate reductase alpha chain